MLELVQFVSVDLTLDPIDFNTANRPIGKWEVSGDSRFAEREKMLQHEIWGALTMFGKTMISMEGELLWDTTEDYIADRMLVNRTILGDLTQIPTDYSLGTLRLQYYGMTEVMSGDVTIAARPELPLQGLYPTVGDFLVNWVVFKPYMIGETSGDPYLY